MYFSKKIPITWDLSVSHRKLDSICGGSVWGPGTRDVGGAWKTRAYIYCNGAKSQTL